MIKIFGKRGTGKTTKLIEISAQKQIPILVVTKQAKYNIMEKANTLGYSIPTPIVFETDNRNIETVLVDNAETLLTGVLRGFNYFPEGMTINTKNIGDNVYEI